jgi:hypothetical protein
MSVRRHVWVSVVEAAEKAAAISGRERQRGVLW